MTQVNILIYILYAMPANTEIRPENRGKFVIKWLLNVPPYLNCVAILSCEI